MSSALAFNREMSCHSLSIHNARNSYLGGDIVPKAIADPEALERFARELKQFNDQLENNMRRLKSQFNRLGETWRDQEHQKFAREFEQTMRVLLQFQRASEQHIPLLMKKAQKLREYLNQR